MSYSMNRFEHLGVTRRCTIAVFSLLCLALSSAGCSTKSMQPGDLTRVQTFSDQPHAGNVYLLRGFIGIWSYGIDGLGDEINQAGVRATVYRNEQWEELTAAIIEKYKDAKGFRAVDYRRPFLGCRPRARCWRKA